MGTSLSLLTFVICLFGDLSYCILFSFENFPDKLLIHLRCPSLFEALCLVRVLFVIRLRLGKLKWTTEENNNIRKNDSAPCHNLVNHLVLCWLNTLIQRETLLFCVDVSRGPFRWFFCREKCDFFSPFDVWPITLKFCPPNQKSIV